MPIDSIDVASLVVALISATVTWSVHRSSRKAAKINTDTVSRIDLEKEAFLRARGYDTETIRRQDEEIDELRKQNLLLKQSDEKKDTEIRLLREVSFKKDAEIRLLTEEITALKAEVEDLKRRVLDTQNDRSDDGR